MQREESRASRRSARPPRLRMQSRSARSGSAGERPARSSAGSPGSGRGRYVPRGTAPGQSLFQVGGNAGHPVPLDKVLDLGTGDDDEVVLGREPVGETAKGLAKGSLHLVAIDGTADLAVDGDPEPDLLALLVLAGEGVEDEIP